MLSFFKSQILPGNKYEYYYYYYYFIFITGDVLINISPKKFIFAALSIATPFIYLVS